MRRSQNKKRTIRTASVGRTQKEEVTLNGTARQLVPFLSTKTSHHPLEKLSWIAGILGFFVAVVALIAALGWFSRPKQNPSVAAANPPGQRLSTSEQPVTHKEEPEPTSSPGTKAVSPSKSLYESKVAEHLARANSLMSQQRYKEALVECDKALQLDGTNKKARALRTNIRNAGTAKILAENDKPKH